MEDRFYINSKDPTPLYAQLERAIRFAIITERLRIGERLPTVRQLAIDLKINANTVAKVYNELEKAGILETRRGVGTFVRTRQQSAVVRAVQIERDRELQAFTDRILAEAHRLGISLDELIGHLKSKRRKGE